VTVNLVVSPPSIQSITINLAPYTLYLTPCTLYLVPYFQLLLFFTLKIQLSIAATKTKLYFCAPKLGTVTHTTAGSRLFSGDQSRLLCH